MGVALEVSMSKHAIASVLRKSVWSRGRPDAAKSRIFPDSAAQPAESGGGPAWRLPSRPTPFIRSASASTAAT